ncbi:uncharacterized protein [Palaemon carinicauda]|uniref:uncharacterized protein n=1 Tax=Palaemon carinicauda TaxID=392227 RepID=UPI0035B602C2
MAVADAKYKFLYIPVGAEGGAGDEGTWSKFNLPEDSTLPNNDTPIAFHIIADDAFALKTTLMKPYSHTSQDHHKIHNYRLSRAHRVVENAFGILQMRFRIFSTPIESPLIIDLRFC